MDDEARHVIRHMSNEISFRFRSLASVSSHLVGAAPGERGAAGGMSVEYVLVSEAEDSEPIELPSEEDGSVLLSTVAAQFASCCGLKYRTAGGRLRGVRLVDERLYPPADGWGAHRYLCVFPRQRETRSEPPARSPAARPRCSDLIVLGLPWKTGEDTVREYFESFGELLMVQVKRDQKTGLSKGFGFIKFADYDAQLRALARRHMIDGRWCDVRIPNSKEGAAARVPSKVFVGRCTENITADDLREYFGAFGQVTDVFIPKPFRAFSFVTFLDPEVAQSLCGQDHIIKGVSVNISTASPKRDRGASASASNPANSGGRGNGPGQALLSWGLVEGAPGTRALFNWVGDAWPQPDTHPAPHPKPYVKYE
ncbi:TAR DNA-binding protein 43 [Eumeta japonica]|uniref:TAR DNA-binding protein 43 n=1 Tax=Eumeta variegata TaxID=151549 RepID=A0A4C1TPF0_EUMVA|nr:TAR DNA-binding protein 43 [Eumeta japonica]